VTDRILIIEAEPSLRKGLNSAFAEAGFAVANVPDYPEALPRINEFEPDIVIMDEALPSGDGTQFCRQLHASRHIPIIIIGSQSGGEVWKRAVNAGADYYLKKPIDSQVSVAIVKAILRRYRASASRSGDER
jgi:two-component system KDP operon response regulator KdpE